MLYIENIDVMVNKTTCDITFKKQELTDLLTFNCLMCKDLQMTGLFTLREQSDLPTLSGLV